MRLVTRTVLLIVLGTGLAHADDERPALSFDATNPTLEDAQAKAKAAGKLLFLEFYLDG